MILLTQRNEQPIAISPTHVTSVLPQPKGCNVYLMDGANIPVLEDFATTVDKIIRENNRK